MPNDLEALHWGMFGSELCVCSALKHRVLKCHMPPSVVELNAHSDAVAGETQPFMC